MPVYVLVVVGWKSERVRRTKGWGAETQNQKGRNRKKQLRNYARDSDNVNASERISKKITTRPLELDILHSLRWHDFAATSSTEVLKDGREPLVWVHYAFTHSSQIRRAWAGRPRCKFINQASDKTEVYLVIFQFLRILINCRVRCIYCTSLAIAVNSTNTGPIKSPCDFIWRPCVKQRESDLQQLSMSHLQNKCSAPLLF